MTQTGKIEANSLISILTDLYKQKDSSKVNDETFKTAFDEAKENNETVSVDILLQQIESDTGIKLEDFSDIEQEAINATLNALSDDSNNIIDDYDDLYDISPEYFDELQEGASLEKLNYEISNTNGSVDATKIKVEEEQGKRIEYSKGYAQLVTIDGEQKVQVCLDDGTVLLTRDLTEEDKVNFGLKTESAEGSEGVSGEESVDGSSAAGAEGGASTEGESLAPAGTSEETLQKISDLKERVKKANENEGWIGKIGGWVKNVFDTKYSSNNINAKIAELEALGDNATEEQWNEVEELVSTYEQKSGGAADKAGNVAAGTVGILAGGAVGAKVGATAGGILGSIFPGPGTAIGAAIGVVAGGLVGIATGALAKFTVGRFDNWSNDKTGDLMDGAQEDAASGAMIGGVAGGLGAVGSVTGIGAKVAGVAGKVLKGTGKAIAAPIKFVGKGVKSLGGKAISMTGGALSKVAGGIKKLFTKS